VDFYTYSHIFLIPIKPGTGAEPIQVAENVSLVDVFPTILGYLDLPIPEHIQGENLSRHKWSTAIPDKNRQIYIESTGPTQFGCNPLLAVISEQWDYISTTEPELYDLHQDPHQLNNLAEQEPQRARLLADDLQEMMLLLKTEESAESLSEPDPERLKGLESLGYVGSISLGTSLEIDPTRKNPKEMIQCNEYLQEASHLMAQERYAEARTFCEKIIAEWPQIADAYSMMTKITYEAQEPAEVIKNGRQYLSLLAETGQKGMQTNLLAGFYYKVMLESALQLEQLDLAESLCQQQLEQEPDSPEALNTLGWVYFRQDRHSQAFDLWGQVLRIKPDLAEAYEYMGRAYQQLGDNEQAIINLNRALRLNPGLVKAQNELRVITQLQLLDQSIARDTELLRRRPNDPTLHSKVARTYYQKGDYQQAIEHLREVIRIQPEDPQAYNNLAGLFIFIKDSDLTNLPEALRLAQRAAELTNNEVAEVLETLGNAYAANGKYDQAITTAEKAQKIATIGGNTALAEKLQQNIKIFKTKRDGN